MGIVVDSDNSGMIIDVDNIFVIEYDTWIDVLFVGYVG